MSSTIINYFFALILVLLASALTYFTLSKLVPIVHFKKSKQSIAVLCFIVNLVSLFIAVMLLQKAIFLIENYNYFIGFIIAVIWGAPSVVYIVKNYKKVYGDNN